ncbi:MAG: NosD domain-containing protein, partial [Acidobacteriota bacterium]
MSYPIPVVPRSRAAGLLLSLAVVLVLGSDPSQAATVIVTNANDSETPGDGCSLREALLAASGVLEPDCGPLLTPGGHTINFNVPDPGPAALPGSPHVVTITPLTPLPSLSGPGAVIDGTTQPSYGGPAATCPGPQAAFGATPYGPLLIEIDGSNYPIGGGGLHIASPSGDGNTIRGLVMNRFAATQAAAIKLDRANGNHIECNLLGTTAVGSAIGGNQYGVRISGGSDNVIEGNLISGATGASPFPVLVESSSLVPTDRTVIRNNRIGTDATGTLGLSPGGGIELLDGGPGTVDDSVIVGNLISQAVGVQVDGPSRTRIQGNRIGTNAAGTGAIAVANSVGVRLNGLAADTLIGTDGDGVGDAAEGNLISGNRFGIQDTTGVAGTGGHHIAGNFIGVDVTGNAALPNTETGIFMVNSTNDVIGTDGDGSPGDAVEGNVISGNGQGGVSLTCVACKVSGNYVGVGADGVTAVPNAVGVLIIAGTGNVLGTDGDGLSDTLERNVISGNTTGAGIGVSLTHELGSGHRVAGNYIGLDTTGTIAVPNRVGVRLQDGAHNDVVGTNGDGTGDAAERNVISGNTQQGVLLFKSNSKQVENNRIAGNWIGLSATGGATIANGTGGISVSGARNNIIGSDNSDPNEANVIVGHTTSATSYGIELTNFAATGNRVEGNFIGTNATGSVVFPNALGVQMSDFSTTTVRRNLIIGNTVRGVDISAAQFLNTPDGSVDNCIVGNAEGARLVFAPPIVFENNWWGAASGPSGDGAGSGDSAFNIDFDPWLVAAPPLTVGCPTALVPSIGKAFLDAQIPNGGTTLLTVTISNPSSAASVTAVTFSDTLPGGLQIAAPAPTASGCGGSLSGSIGGTVFGITGGTIAPSSTCIVQVTVLGIADGPQTNQITNFTSNPAPASASSNAATVEVTPSADLAVTKTDGVVTATPGGSVTYTITASNAGPSNTTGTVADTFPASLTCNWTCVGAGG